jgi:hypothetical protein
MRTIILILFAVISAILNAQVTPEIEVKSKISDVTVYITGAQIKRTADIDINAGKTILKFVDLSPYVDAKSINVKSTGDFTILSVNHYQNFLKQQIKTKTLDELMSKKDDLEKKINLEKTYIDILNEELNFMRRFSAVDANNSIINVSSFKESVTYFTDKVTANKLKQVERNNNIELLSKDLDKVKSQLKLETEKSDIPTGEIFLSIDSKRNVHATFDISYIVKNAGWFPSYDIRVKSIDDPVTLIYRANIHQNTYEDWNNIKLSLSSADPNEETTFQDLKPYLLSYNMLPPSYSNNINQVTGYIYDGSTKEPLIGVTVNLKGTTIGALADVNGFYKITIPPTGGQLVYSYIGYKTQELPISSQNMNIILEQDAVSLDEVVVVGYGVQKKSNLTGSVSGVSTSNLDKSIKIRGTSSIQQSPLVEIVPTRNQTNFEFTISSPYSVPSNGKNLTVDFNNFDLPATYEYYATPKIDNNAYLLVHILDWQKYNLLEGEANIFFEDTFTGKTLLDVRYMSDTLSISLGKDKSVSIKREIQKQFTTKQFLGTKKEETKSWLISVKNNKLQNINITILDQIPVSTLEEIEVSPITLSNATLDKEVGKLTWKIDLKPSEKKDIELKYSVKYPKFRTLIIE